MPELVAYTKEDVPIHAAHIVAEYNHARSAPERWIVNVSLKKFSDHNMRTFTSFGPSMEVCYERIAGQMTRQLLQVARK